MDVGILEVMRDPDSQLHKSLFQNVRVVSETALDLMALIAKNVLMVSRFTYSGTLKFDGSFPKASTSKYRVLENDIYEGKTTIYLHIHSQHLNDFWQYMQLLAAQGLLQQWEHLGSDKVFELDKTSSQSTNGHIILTIEHTKGIFVFWIIGMLISLIVFVFEVVLNSRNSAMDRLQVVP